MERIAAHTYKIRGTAKELGCNFVRLAHYPQDPVVLQTADKLGLLIWIELPNLNYIVPSAEITKSVPPLLLIHKS